MSKKIDDFIISADAKLNKSAGYEANNLRTFYESLIKGGFVEVGWRESCGATHQTHRTYREWVKLIKKIREEGIIVQEQRRTHGNAYATNNGGFWNSIVYTLNNGHK